MFRKDFETIPDDEFLELVEPHNVAISEYINKNILYEFVAFYIAKGYELNALWEENLTSHVNSAIEHLSAVEFKNSYDYDKLKKVLEEQYSLIVVNDSPLQVEKKDIA